MSMQTLPAHTVRALVLLLAVAVVSAVAGFEFAEMWEPDRILPGTAVTRIGHLSDYHAGLRDTRYDATVYYMEGDEPGGTALVLGGTHPNETAGFMAALVLIERCGVASGRLIVIPQACSSGFTCTDPLEAYPQQFQVSTASGVRTFRYGARAANWVDQWPDPLVFLQYPSGQQLSGFETRNLNRAYPGRPDGTLTEQTAFAIMELLRREGVDVAFDLHEAAPEFPNVNAIVTHEKGQDLAAQAVLALEFEDLQYSLELSPENFRGLSHREWGDRTGAIPFLMETSNPIQGRLRGRTSAELLLTGVDSLYARAGRSGVMRVTYDVGGEPLSRRVGRHLAGVVALLDAYSGTYAERPVILENVPAYDEMMSKGLGAFLR
jgi:predicted deacylase